MIGHQNEFVQKIGVTAVRKEYFEKEARPRFRLEERAALPRIGRDEVSLRVVCCVLACGLQNLPSAAKAAAS
jgi:hypothetical protein